MNWRGFMNASSTGSAGVAKVTVAAQAVAGRVEMVICIEKSFMLLFTWHMALKGKHSMPWAPIF